MRTALVVIVMALAALIWLNPDADAFRAYTEARSEQFLLEEAGETALGRALSGAGGVLAGAVVGHLAERRNYLVVSLYTLDLDGEDKAENEWRFLGIAGQFIELHRPEALRERPRR